MAGELEKFLQQAAERLAEKLNQGQRGNRPSPPPKSSPRPAPPRVSVRQAERRSIDPETVDAEILDAEMVPQHLRRELGPDPLSNLDTRPQMFAREIDQADEKMAGHVSQELDHEIMHLKSASAALGGGERQPNTRDASQVQRRNRSVSPLIDMLRQPESLRAAFVASEIFRRKF